MNLLHKIIVVINIEVKKLELIVYFLECINTLERCVFQRNCVIVSAFWRWKFVAEHRQA